MIRRLFTLVHLRASSLQHVKGEVLSISIFWSEPGGITQQAEYEIARTTCYYLIYTAKTEILLGVIR